MELQYFEIGPLMKGQKRVSVEINIIPAMSKGMDLSLANEIRDFILSEVGVIGSDRTNFPKEGIYSLLQFKEFFLLTYAEISNVYDEARDSYPIVRRCIILTEEQFYSLNGWPGTIIKYLSNNYSSIDIYDEIHYDVNPISIPLPSNSLEITLDEHSEYIINKEDIFIPCLVTWLDTGYLHIQASSNYPLEKRLELLLNMIVAIPRQYRSLFTFSTSSTKPQDSRYSSIIFVDAGTSIKAYTVDLSNPKVYRKANGINYAIKVLEAAKKHLDKQNTLENFYAKLQLPNSTISIAKPIGLTLDQSIDFENWSDHVEKILETPLDHQETSSIIKIANELYSFRNWYSKKDFAKQVIRIFSKQVELYLYTNAAIFIVNNSELMDESEQELITSLIKVTKNNIHNTGNIEFIKELVVQFQTIKNKSVWETNIYQLLDEIFIALEEHNLEEQAAFLWVWLKKRNWYPQKKHEREGLHLLNILKTSKGLQSLLVTMIENQIDVMLYAKIILKAASPKSNLFTIALINSILNQKAEDEEKDLLFRSYEEINSISWLFWSIEQVNRRSLYKLVGVSTINLLIQVSRDNTYAADLLKKWEDLWISEPQILFAFDTPYTLPVIRDWAFSHKKIYLSVVSVWATYKGSEFNEEDIYLTKSHLFELTQKLIKQYDKDINLIKGYIFSKKLIEKRFFSHILQNVPPDPSLEVFALQLFPLYTHLNPFIRATVARHLLLFTSEKFLKKHLKEFLTIYLELLDYPDNSEYHLELFRLAESIQKRNLRWVWKAYLDMFEEKMHQCIIRDPEKYLRSLNRVFAERQDIFIEERKRFYKLSSKYQVNL